MYLRFVVIDNCPVPRLLARKVKALKRDVPSARLNSCYRGERAKRLLHKLGKHTQRELYVAWLRGHGNPANPPGFSSHELFSDGNKVYGPRGHPIPWWKVGMDWNDQDVPKLIHAARRRGWTLVRPYPSGSEFHHVSFGRKP